VSFKANDIACLLMSITWCFNLGEDVNSLITIVLIEWLIANTAYHIVNWPGGFRYVIGILFSGDYNTSFLNTLHLIVVLCCYLRHEALRCKDAGDYVGASLWIWAFTTGDFRAVVQGDDIIGSFSKALQAHGGSPDGLRSYIQEKFKMKIKPEAYRVNVRLDVDVNEFGFVVTKDPIVFLKRNFFKCKVGDKIIIRPYRCTLDYIDRMFVSTSGMVTSYDCIAKYIGLCLDTLGVNIIAYYLCLHSIAFLIADKTLFPNGCQSRRLNERLSAEKFMQERLYKMNLKYMEPEDYLSLSQDHARLLRMVDGDMMSEDEQLLTHLSPRERNLPPSKY